MKLVDIKPVTDIPSLQGEVMNRMRVLLNDLIVSHEVQHFTIEGMLFDLACEYRDASLETEE